MNELETAAVYRIRPKWNKIETYTDWSFVGEHSWKELKSEVMKGHYRKSAWYKKLEKKDKTLLKKLKNE